MKLAFMGTPEFAIPSLAALANSDHELCLVITQPDRPKGRGRKTCPPAVKVEADRNGIPVMQAESVKDSNVYEKLTELAPDAVVVVAYGQIIPQDMLSIPRYGFINVHASILPLYRGAAPINRAILDGCSVTGVSIMKLDSGLDSGPVYLSAEVPVQDGDDATSLSDRLSRLGAEKLLETLTLIGKGKIEPKEQDHEKATYAPSLKKQDGLIDWDHDPVSIYNRIRGLVPWPCAYTYMDLRLLKIWKASIYFEDHNLMHGTLVKDGKAIKIACAGGFVVPERVQIEGKKIMDCKAFACGLRKANMLLGKGS